MHISSWPEIRNRATAFAREWREATSERAEAQTFWNEFFEIFGVKRRRVAVYEKQVDKLPIVREQDEAQFNRYRTKDLVLGYMNALAAGDTQTVLAL